jgi:hypothetical protein
MSAIRAVSNRMADMKYHREVPGATVVAMRQLSTSHELFDIVMGRVLQQF